MQKPPLARVMEAGDGVEDLGRPWKTLASGREVDFYCKGSEETTERVDDDYLLMGIV